MKEYKEYNSTENNFMETLDKYGVCVIPDIFTESECIKLRDKIWEGIKHIQKDRFDINDKKTWMNFYDFFPSQSMLIQHFSIAHLQGVWDIRQDERIANIFSKIWNCKKEDLVTSFDGISINLPPEQTNHGWFFGGDFMHTDQSPQKKGFQCIQGMVNLYPVNDNDATLTIMEGSHKYHEEFFKKIKYDDPEDWYELQEGEKEYFEKIGCKQFCVKAPIGSLVLWDSRTFHQGIEAQKEREKENFRMVVYTCLRPRNHFTIEELNKHKKAFLEKRVTNHWGTMLFSKNPKTYNDKLKEFNEVSEPVLTDFGKKLI